MQKLVFNPFKQVANHDFLYFIRLVCLLTELN